uniref:Ig-like domain-containing protein n=1 Tax=Astyanax mexicanus TaxID=7994 RepID=A0A3B1KG15_ASTMX
ISWSLNIYTCLFICFISAGVKCESMESLQTAVQKKPGETLSLSCRGSGFNFREYNMHWIRQQTGKPMEWMCRLYGNGQNLYATRFEGRTKITRDDSSSMVYLKLSAEDSAVYYCARSAQ